MLNNNKKNTIWKLQCGKWIRMMRRYTYTWTVQFQLTAIEPLTHLPRPLSGSFTGLIFKILVSTWVYNQDQWHDIIIWAFAFIAKLVWSRIINMVWDRVQGILGKIEFVP